MCTDEVASPGTMIRKTVLQVRIPLPPPGFLPFCRLRFSPRRKRDFAGFSGALPVLVLRAIAQRPCEPRFPRYWRYRLVSRTGPVRTSPAKRARLAVTWRKLRRETRSEPAFKSEPAWMIDLDGRLVRLKRRSGADRSSQWGS